MSVGETKRLGQLTSLIIQAHPWHGVSPGPTAPEEVVAYVEIVPTDAVKYELDKVSGHLRIDRPQRYSSFCPTLYGFIPQTYCAERTAERAVERTRFDALSGDGDPLDICILTEKAFSHGNFLLRARPVGGLTMIDKGEADDKIIAVLENDNMWGTARDVSDVPPVLIERLQHYFLTYKLVPGQRPVARIRSVYGRDHALKVVKAAMADYDAAFLGGDPTP